MRPEDIVHKLKSSSWWRGTETMWCGITADEDITTGTWFSSVDCQGCLAALAAAGKKP